MPRVGVPQSRQGFTTCAPCRMVPDCGKVGASGRRTMLDSERVVVQSPMSFSGSARRIWLALVTGKPALLKWGLTVWLALVLVATVWTVIAAWYLMFGLLVVPWRLLRRGSRKRKRDELRHREMLGR